MGASFDLHVLSTPPAFILSQDQTLMLFQRQALRLPLKVLFPRPEKLAFLSASFIRKIHSFLLGTDRLF